MAQRLGLLERMATDCTCTLGDDEIASQTTDTKLKQGKTKIELYEWRRLKNISLDSVHNSYPGHAKERANVLKTGHLNKGKHVFRLG